MKLVGCKCTITFSTIFHTERISHELRRLWLDGKFMPQCCDVEYAGVPYHVVLGAGSVKVGMRKQSTTVVYQDGFEYTVPQLHYFYELVESEEIVTCDVGYSELSVAYRYTDNYYQFVELRGMAGGTWHGFSGNSVDMVIQEVESLFGVELERPKFSY